MNIKVGDKIETSIGNIYIVGAIHDRDGIWIEPEGAHEYTYWIPIEHVVKVNGENYVT